MLYNITHSKLTIIMGSRKNALVSLQVAAVNQGIANLKLHHHQLINSSGLL